MAIFECAKCRDTCSVRFDDDVTEFCCGCAHDEIARLKVEVAEARRHAVGVMAAGFNRALDRAGAPAAESPGLRVYAMRDENARLKADAARLAEALRGLVKHRAHRSDGCAVCDPAYDALAAHDAGEKRGGGT